MLPATTPESRARSLSKATRVKDQRYALRSSLRVLGRQGAGRLADVVLSEPVGALRTIYVWQLVRWVPGVGDQKCKSILKGADIDPWAKLGRVTARQRELLAEDLRRFADGRPATVPMRARGRARVDPRTCQGCGERMLHPAVGGLCGFCQEGM